MAATQQAVELAKQAASAAEEKLASSVVAIDVSEQLALTDIFLIAAASNERQVGAIVDGVIERLHTLGVKPLRREGQREDRWVLLDFGDIVVHVQHEEEREFYALDRLWRDCPVVELA
ncbi:ribosome silencing factor [Dermatophilaceae bacterium Sec6.4]|nr:ribosome silencing factor [Actinomycetota bacterium]